MEQEKDVIEGVGSITAPAQENTSPEVEPEVETTGEDDRGPTGWIPKVRFQEVVAEKNSAQGELAKEREARIRLEERINASQPAGNDKPERELTRVELRALIERGDITQEQADSYMDAQIEKRAVEKARTSFEASMATQSRVSGVSSQLGEYAKLVPNAAVRGTPERLAAERAYVEVVERLGPPRGKEQELAYELTALERVFGTVTNLKRAGDKRAAHEPFSDTTTSAPPGVKTGDKGGSGASVDERAVRAKLSSRQAEHYDKMIKAGRYRGGWKEVGEELSFKAPAL